MFCYCNVSGSFRCEEHCLSKKNLKWSTTLCLKSWMSNHPSQRRLERDLKHCLLTKNLKGSATLCLKTWWTNHPSRRTLERSFRELSQPDQVQVQIKKLKAVLGCKNLRGLSLWPVERVAPLAFHRNYLEIYLRSNS